MSVLALMAAPASDLQFRQYQSELRRAVRKAHWPKRPIRVRQTYSCLLKRTAGAPAGYPVRVKLRLAREEIGERGTSSIRGAAMLNGSGTTFDPPREGNADMAGLRWRTRGGRAASIILSMGEFPPTRGMTQSGDARLYIGGIEAYRGDCISKWAEYKEIKK